MTGTQLKDLWSQWTVQTKSGWMKLIGPFTNHAGRIDSTTAIGPIQQHGSHEVPKPDLRGPPVRVAD